MKVLLLILLSYSLVAQAHCPFEVKDGGKDYCFDLIWQTGEKKIRGEFEQTDLMSPLLIPMGEVPQKWIYSTALVSVWEKGDANHSPVEIPHFRIFPYMHMLNGHHHSAPYGFYFSAEEQSYVFSRVAFQQMPGCWSLRWTVDSEDNLNSSQWILNIVGFSNFNEAQVQEQQQVCEDLSGEETGDSSGHHHHH